MTKIDRKQIKKLSRAIGKAADELAKLGLSFLGIAILVVSMGWWISLLVIFVLVLNLYVAFTEEGDDHRC